MYLEAVCACIFMHLFVGNRELNSEVTGNTVSPFSWKVTQRAWIEWLKPDLDYSLETPHLMNSGLNARCSGINEHWTEGQGHTFEEMYVSITKKSRVGRTDFRGWQQALSEPRRTVLWTLGGGDMAWALMLWEEKLSLTACQQPRSSGPKDLLCRGQVCAFDNSYI